MKTSPAFIFVSIQLVAACAELIFQRAMEGQTLSLSCPLLPQQQQQEEEGGGSSLAGLHLYHRSARGQTTLLSLAEGGHIRADPELGARLQLSGGLDSHKVDVTISHLEPRDTGLYVWELSYREENSSHQLPPLPLPLLLLLPAPQTFLLVEGSGSSCQCSASYPPLLLTTFSAAGLLLLVLVCLAVEKCVKAKRHPGPQPHAPIYEEMSWKRQSAGSPKNSCEGPSHLEEVHFPVYANPHRQPQDNYYACPRQLGLRASHGNL